jgi:hypothetical protein
MEVRVGDVLRSLQTGTLMVGHPTLAIFLGVNAMPQPGVNRFEATRAVLGELGLDASPAEVVQKLKAQGIEIDATFVAMVKAKMRKVLRPGVNKLEATKLMFGQMGLDASPTEVARRLNAEGIDVDANFVSSVKSKMRIASFKPRKDRYFSSDF